MKNLVTTLSLLMSLVSYAKEGPQATGTRGGADQVEPLFIAAQTEAISIVNKINLNRVDKLNIPTFYKNWLKKSDHLSKLQYYVTAMELVFQDEPCLKDRGVCFDDTDPDRPKMIVSYQLNKTTTPSQARALVIHEAGHGVGETNHRFLSGLGHALIENPYSSMIRAHGGRIENPDNSVTLILPQYWSTEFGKWVPIWAEYAHHWYTGIPEDYDVCSDAAGVCAHLGFSECLGGESRYNFKRYKKRYSRNIHRNVQAASLHENGRFFGISRTRTIIHSVTCGR